ncbi:MAG TPA: transporter substrate-binding domain-containing protein [Roseateles sp.]
MKKVGRIGMACLAAFTVGAAGAEGGLDRIRVRGQINVGYREDAAPFSYLDAQGKPQGYSLEFCNAVVAQVLAQPGMSKLRVQMVSVPVDGVLKFMKSGTVDLLCSSTSDTPERRKVMAFSRPIFIDGVSIMVRKADSVTTLADLGMGPVAAIKSTTAPAALSAAAPAIKIAPVLNGDAGVGQLKLQWAKGFARDRVLLAMQRAQLSDANEFIILPDLLSTETIAIAVPLASDDLLALANKTFADAATAGRVNAWHKRWFEEPVVLNGRSITLNLPVSAELKALLGNTRQ